MSELTDLEICKKIAEIEGKGITFCRQMNEINIDCYNPLTDDSLWSKLIISHEVSIDFIFCKLFTITNKFYESEFSDIPSLKRNSLLLIIEANKDK